MQSYLSIFALLLTTFLAIMLYSWVGRSYDHGYYVDTMQEIRAVNIDFFDYLATRPFDERTDSVGVVGFDTPYLTSELESPANFGGAGCTPFVNCNDIDDFHGKTITRTLSWFDLQIRVEVVYVSVLNPDQETGTQSWAKEVRLYSSSPVLEEFQPGIGEIRMARVYTYYHKQTPP